MRRVGAGLLWGSVVLLACADRETRLVEDMQHQCVAHGGLKNWHYTDSASGKAVGVCEDLHPIKAQAR